MDIEKIEDELVDLLNKDRQNWVQIFRLMDQVDKEKAYTTPSYTKWVENLADKAKVHVSLLWARKKAGAAYEKYAQRAESKGIKVAPLEDLKISPDNINLVEKIAGTNDAVADELMKKVADNELHRTDLQKAWADVKAERVAKGLKPARVTRHDADTIDEPTDSVSANAIVFSLQNSKNWLLESIGKPLGEFSTYKALPEFAVRPGTSRHARRIDVAVLEDFSNSIIPGNHGITIHGIEIKVSKSDLLNDTKMAEYTDYCNYFWLAIPEELIEDAEAYVMDSWGILVFDKGQMKVHKKAEELEAVMREDTLIEAIKRLC